MVNPPFWLNVYLTDQGFPYARHVAYDRAACVRYAAQTPETRIACVEVPWRPGEGLGAAQQGLDGPAASSVDPQPKLPLDGAVA